MPPAQGPLTPTRLMLPRLDSHLVALRNRAYAAPAAPLRNGRTLVWQDSGRFHAEGELICRAGGLTFAMCADSLSVLEPRLQGFESIAPAHGCTVLVEHALAPVLDLIETLTGHSVICEEFVRVAAANRSRTLAIDSSAVHIGFVLFAAGNRTKVRGSVRATAMFWHGVDFSRTPLSPVARQQAVPLRMAAQLGRCRLALAELRSLRPGDALRVTPKPLRQAVGLAVQLIHPSGRFGCQARLIDDRLVLITPMDSLVDTPTDTPMDTRIDTPMDTSSSPSGLAAGLRANAAAPANAPANASASASAHARLGDSTFAAGIECELSFELGSIRMTLGEIAKLRVGQALRMGLRLQEQPISILTSGRQIARGELAAVGDELVVVVTQTHGLPDV
jgi:type III secretion system YscQ/HrcQ family protein